MLPPTHQIGDELRPVDNLVVAAEIRILVGLRVLNAWGQLVTIFFTP
jgi:hypothetical protein